jgi:hypothetical protein
VKRHFNVEVVSGVRSQLAEAYLLSQGRTHGIYLVGWYVPLGGNKPNPLHAETFEEAILRLDLEVQLVLSDHANLRLKGVCLNCEFPEAFRKAAPAKMKVPRKTGTTGRRK